MEALGLKALVTGGTGFIGSNLVKSLIYKGFEVYILSRPQSSNSRLSKYSNLKYIYSSAKDLINIENLPQFDICFNLAAYGVDYRQQDIYEMVNGNINFILDVINFCEKNKTKRLVHTGSCFEYGNNEGKPIKEDAPLNPHTLYSASKASGIIMANAYAKSKNVKLVTVRPFGVYGIEEGSHRLVPQLINTILQNKELDMTDGKQIRDYLFVNDLVDGYIEIATDTRVRDYEIYNVSSSEEITIRALVTTLCKVCNYSESKFNFGKIPYRENEVMYFVGDNSKIYRTIGWKPKTKLEDGLKTTFEWYKEIMGNKIDN